MDENAANNGPGQFADADERIYALLSVVEDQQTAVRAGIQGLAIERAELHTERVAIVQQAEHLKRLTDKLVSAISTAIPQMAQTAGEASRQAFREMLVASGKAVAESVVRSSQPGLDQLKAAVDSAQAERLELKKAVEDFQKRWAWAVGMATLGLLVAATLVSVATIWWQSEELPQLVKQKDKLSAEVKALQEQADQAKRNNARKPTGK